MVKMRRNVGILREKSNTNFAKRTPIFRNEINFMQTAGPEGKQVVTMKGKKKFRRRKFYLLRTMPCTMAFANC